MIYIIYSSSLYFYISIMDYILSNIGPNKVTVNIRDSPYNERSANTKSCVSTTTPKKTAIDLVDMYKRLGRAEEKKDILPNKMEDQLLFNLMKLTDPLLSLYNSPKEIDAKIIKFKDELIKNLTNFNGMFKKLLLHKKYKLEEVQEAIHDSTCDFEKRRPLLLYIARLLDISIMIEFTNDKLPYLIKCGQKCKILKYDIQEHNMVLNLEDYDVSVKEYHLHQAKMAKYIGEGLKNKMPKYTVKELREVCEDLDISIYTEEEGLKKLCLKPELFNRISKKIESHNT